MFQYCIIGGGPAGLVLANTLRQRVPPEAIIILEAGSETEPNEEAAKFVSKGQTEYKPIRSFRLGGHGHLWGGACPRLHSDDFRMRSRFGLYVDWPIEYADLEPYYERAEKLLSVGPRATEVSLDMKEDPVAKGLVESGYNGTLQYADRAYFVERLLPELQASSVEIRTRSVVRRIDETADGIARVSYHDLDSGTTHQLDAGRVVLCCGGLSNARILQLSKSERFPQGIGNHAGMLGRYHMDHPRIVATIERSYSPRQGAVRQEGMLPLTMAKVVDHAHPDIAFASITIGRRNAVSLAQTELEATLRQFRGADELQDGLKALLSTSDRVTFDLETMDPPGHANVLELADELDALGDPMLATNINIDAERAQVDNKILSILGQAFAKAGYRLASLSKSGWTGQHPSGSTRMAAKRQDGVVDANLKVFDTQSIYVCGSSVFPTVGYANPTLTIVSLALRLADHLIESNEKNHA